MLPGVGDGGAVMRKWSKARSGEGCPDESPSIITRDRLYSASSGVRTPPLRGRRAHRRSSDGRRDAASRVTSRRKYAEFPQSGLTRGAFVPYSNAQSIGQMGGRGIYYNSRGTAKFRLSLVKSTRGGVLSNQVHRPNSAANELTA